MSSPVQCVYEEQSAEDAAKTMSKFKLRRLPVLNREERLVGIVSLGDLSLRGAELAAAALRTVSKRGG